MKRRDLVAGISLAGLMLPEAVAYAGIAGLSAGRAIVAAIAGCFVYSLVGRSRFAIVSPTSSSAAILAATLASVPDLAANKDAAAAIVIAFAGLIFIIGWALKLGGLTSFIARPVLRGFAFGLAITIIVRQLPAVTGTKVDAANIFTILHQLIASAASWHPASIATGAVALALLLALRRAPMLPGAFIVLALGVAASTLLNLPAHGVATVGWITTGLAGFAMPDFAIGDYSRLAQLALPLALILLAESWGTMRALALRHGDRVDAGREIGALGLANIAAAAVQGMPVGAGFSAGSAAEAAGAATRATAAIAAAGLALLVLVAMPLIAWLPGPVLAAVVIVALLHALDPKPILRLWRLNRDQYVAIGAALAVLLLGVLNGMLAAIALSLAALIRRLAIPPVLELGRLGHSHDFVDLARHADAARIPGIAIFRPAEPLFFANAERSFAAIEARMAGQSVSALVVSLEESFDLDSTALDALIEFRVRMHKQGVGLWLARAHDHVHDVLIAAGETGLAERSGFSVDDTVRAAQESPPPSGARSPP